MAAYPRRANRVPEFDVGSKGLALGLSAPQWRAALAICCLAVAMLPAAAQSQEQPASGSRPYLGVQLNSLSRWQALLKGLPLRAAAAVTKVEAGSPAAAAGLQSGDVLLEIDGTAVESGAQALKLIAGKTPGATVALRFQRNGKEKTARAGLGVKPGEPSAPSMAPASEAAGPARQQKAPEPRTEDLAALDARIGELHRQAKYAEALPLAERYVAAALQQNDGPPAYATAIGWEGVLYKELGRYREAEPLLKEALELRERELGAGHADTLASVSALGQLYAARGQQNKAEALYRRALEGYQSLSGKPGRQTIGALHNLGALYAAQGRGDAAEPLFRRALEASERTLGTNHPVTLTGVGALALLYQVQGRFKEAGPLFKRGLESKERALGKDHPETLNFVANLGECYRRQGRLAESEPLLKRALETRERVLGKEHPDTLLSAGHLGVLYKDLGRNDEAWELLKRGAQAQQGSQRQ